MQFEPPTKTSDVAVNVDNESSSPGTDHNGLFTGRWKTGLFGFTDSIVPNAIMSFCCPAISVAQISARVGMMPFYHVLGLFGGLYFLVFLGAVTDADFFEGLAWIVTIIAALYCVFSFCCGCCSIAQMASHVESYEPGTFAFKPRETLPGYTFN